jgi:hypothetical protein
MIRWFGALTLSALVFGTGTATTCAVAVPEDSGRCTWVPFAPSVVAVSDSQMVTAKLGRGPCTLHANPSGMTVCLSIQGEGSAGDCASTNTSEPAQVYYKYRPGATYIMTGQGCANILQPPFKICEDYGPTSYRM